MTLALVKDLERVRLACRYLLKGYSQTQPAPITVNVHQHTSRVCGAPTTRPLCILGSVTWSRGGRPYEMQTLQPESGKKNRKQVPCSRAPGGKLVSIFCSIWFLFLFLSFFSLSFFVFPFQHEKKKKKKLPALARVKCIGLGGKYLGIPIVLLTKFAAICDMWYNWTAVNTEIVLIDQINSRKPFTRYKEVEGALNSLCGV